MIKKLILYILIAVGLSSQLSAKSPTWTTLKYLGEYKSKDFNLKETLLYLEVRQYEAREDGTLRDKPYRVPFSFYRKKLSSFDNKTINKFKKVKPNLKLDSDISINYFESSGKGCYYKYGAFMIDMAGKIWRMNTVEDIINHLGEIDTPAELQVVLKLHNKNQGDSYRKVPKGYEVINTRRDLICNKDGLMSYKTFKLLIDKKGKIIKETYIKTVHTKNPCVMCVPPLDCTD